MSKRLAVELAREEDGRWIGAVPKLPGVLVYGKTEKEAYTKARALALRVLADRIEDGTIPSGPVDVALA